MCACVIACVCAKRFCFDIKTVKKKLQGKQSAYLMYAIITTQPAGYVVLVHILAILNIDVMQNSSVVIGAVRIVPL